MKYAGHHNENTAMRQGAPNKHAPALTTSSWEPRGVRSGPLSNVRTGSHSTRYFRTTSPPSDSGANQMARIVVPLAAARDTRVGTSGFCRGGARVMGRDDCG